MKIRIVFGGVEVGGELNNTQTSQEIIKALPIEGEVNTWGEEIYLQIPISTDEEPISADVEVGDIAYWPPGKAFCIFFGRTPASINENPRAASPVVVLGKVTSGLELLARVKDGERVVIKTSTARSR